MNDFMVNISLSIKMEFMFERRLDGLLSRPDGCKLEQKLLDTVEGPNGNPRRPYE